VNSSGRRYTAQRRKARNLSQKFAGSHNQGEPVFVVVGIIRRPHGLKGEVLVSLETDFPERLAKGVTLFLGDDHRQGTIDSSRHHGEGLLLSFKEFPDKESVEDLHNVVLSRKATELPPLPNGAVYQHHLIGLDVFEENGEVLGALDQILSTGATDIYLVKDNSGQEILLPATQDVIRNIDLTNKRIIVHLIPGLR
jgi:16S rRNA processing protein RimM